MFNRWLLTGLFSVLAGALCHAQDAGRADYPTRPVRIVVPYAAGGTADVLARKIGEKLSSRLKQPVYIDNRPGANTVIASEHVAASESDGYTLFSTNTTLLQMPFLAPTKFDALRDFTPIAQYCSAPLLLSVPAALPVNNVRDLFAYIKSRPAKTSYASAGVGGTQHIYSEALRRAGGLDSVHIPYKGEAPLVADLIAGRIDWYIGTPLTLLPHVRNGRLKLLAVSGDERMPLAPSIPTFQEEGVHDLVVVGWYGMFVASKTPKHIVERLSKEVTEIVQSPDIAHYLRDNGLIPSNVGTTEFASKLPEWRATFGRLIKDNDIKLE